MSPVPESPAWRPWPKSTPGFAALTCDVSYTLMDPRDLSLDEILAYRARHLLQTGLAYQFGPVELSADYRYISRLDHVKPLSMDDRGGAKNRQFAFGISMACLASQRPCVQPFQPLHTQMERTLMPIRHFVRR
jgi:hypothetical protein